MTAIHETAYPRIRSSITAGELDELYKPTQEQLEFADRSTREPIQKLGLLVLLKVFQRLGYFPMLREIPLPVVQYIARCAKLEGAIPHLASYEKVRSRTQHLPKIRAFLGVKEFRTGGEPIMNQTLINACQTRDIIADIINVAIEELVRQSYELPAFSTLLRAANRARLEVNSGFYKTVASSLSEAHRAKLDELLSRVPEEVTSPWHWLKQEPKRVTVKNMRESIEHLRWLQSLNIESMALEPIPEVKFQRFSDEARSLNVNEMNDLPEEKRYTIATALVRSQTAQAIDDLADMFIRSVKKLHNSGNDALDEYRRIHQGKTDRLIEILSRMLTIVNSSQNPEEQMMAIQNILGDDAERITEECTTYLGYAGNNYLPFLTKFYGNRRRNLFDFLMILRPRSTNSNTALEEAIDFLIQHRHCRTKSLQVTWKDNVSGKAQTLNLSWIPPKWWKVVTGSPKRDASVGSVDRRYFEICLFSCVMLGLKSGDLFIEGSEKYGDYRNQLISWDEYWSSLDTYCEQIGCSADPDIFVDHLKERLTSTILSVDASFPSNDSVSIEKGEPVIHRPIKREKPRGLDTIERMLAQRIPERNIMDVLSDTEHWLNWTKPFHPVSGYESKLEDPRQRYIITTFCYGCNLGPTQAAQSIEDLDRRQVAYVNQRHIDEQKLLRANVHVINQYNTFALPKFWGSGKSASADGTKWDVYEQNLLSEYHIRYGGWGGIGYYHVSDTYIALFSSFISCGVWEAVYILDGLMENKSDIQPDTLHADTQGQSESVFGLARLLSIKLMPRIRNWKDLTLYFPSDGFRVNHIHELFSDTIDWELIRNHFHDMMRVAISISKGRIRSSTILRKLSTYSRKNRLYLAFRELGRADRTEFLLTYLSSIECRRMIQDATNKSESWNDFIQWVAFGGSSIRENDRREQRKIIRYNHLVANLIIFHNVATMTRVLSELAAEGYPVNEEILSRLSPYKREHINRFGSYKLHLDQVPEPIVQELELGAIDA